MISSPYALSPRPRSWDRPALAASLLFSALLMGAVYIAEPAQHIPGRAAASRVVQQVVQQQMHALATQDAMQAFALADTDLRLQFGTADAFLTTVREQYPMLLHPASVLFLKPETDGTIAMQKVRVTDEHGSSWSLTYLLNRRQDNQWRISGCLVTPQGRQILT
jgi:hypothetical protein